MLMTRTLDSADRKPMYRVVVIGPFRTRSEAVTHAALHATTVPKAVFKEPYLSNYRWHLPVRLPIETTDKQVARLEAEFFAPKLKPVAN